MKAIHYDAEGDILSVTFTETNEQSHTGIELSDNIILYYNPKTEQPLKLILVSYQALLQASIQAPVLLDGFAQAPVKVRKIVTSMLQRAPLTAFMQFVKAQGKMPPSSQLQEVVTPTTLHSVAAS